jgi:hypothetical protein
MVVPPTETGNDSNNEKERYKGSSEIKMLTGYYISCKDNENIIEASLVIKGKSKSIPPLFICLQEPLVISK